MITSRKLSPSYSTFQRVPRGPIALDAEYQVEDLDNSESNVFRIARDARQGLNDAQETADEALRQAIQEGRNHNLSMRDIATMADISYQRVSQIASTL